MSAKLWFVEAVGKALLPVKHNEGSSGQHQAAEEDGHGEMLVLQRDNYNVNFIDNLSPLC